MLHKTLVLLQVVEGESLLHEPVVAEEQLLLGFLRVGPEEKDVGEIGAQFIGHLDRVFGGHVRATKILREGVQAGVVLIFKSGLPQAQQYILGGSERLLLRQVAPHRVTNLGTVVYPAHLLNKRAPPIISVVKPAEGGAG